ncbi:hypothetical protein ACTPOK_04290 [Streptomyces inhibens]|uniref:hypothetical protein n=1 Tax=Streptomyces inhibens TaxID=2293571 RepID=UPI00402B01DB
MDGTVADTHWCDTQFPKVIQRRSTPNNRGSETDSTDPKAPEPTAQELLTLARAQFYEAATNAMPTAVVDLITTARELLDAAQTADQAALRGATDDEISAIAQALSVTKRDLQDLGSTVADMRFGLARLVESVTEKFLTEVAGEGE